MAIRLPKLTVADYESGVPIITIERVLQPAIHNVEVPIDKAVPRLLRTRTGRIAAHLIQYGNFGDEDPVVFTRRCLYVDAATWQLVKGQYDAWNKPLGR